MNILIITDNFPPECNASASRVFERARLWVKKGHSVKVITSFPNHPCGRKYPGYQHGFYLKEVVEGIIVYRVKTFISRKNSFFSRFFDLSSFLFTSMLASFYVKNFDFVIGNSPNFFAAMSAYCISRFRNKEYIFEIADLWPESIRAVGQLKNKYLYRLVEKIEIFLYKKATKIVAQTDAFKKDLVSRGVDEKKITVIMNGVSINKFYPRPEDNYFKTKLGIEGKYILSYFGTHGAGQNLLSFLRLAKYTKSNSNITYLLVGDGTEKKMLIDYKNKHSLDNVVFLSQVTKEEIIRLWSISYIALVPVSNHSCFSKVVPSKLYEACAMGVPICLVSPPGEASKLLSKFGSGLYYEKINNQVLYQDLMEVINMPSYYRTLAKNAVLLAKEFSREKQSDAYLDLLRDSFSISSVSINN